MIHAYAAPAAGAALQPYDYDPGDLRGNEVEIDVEHCGICHSDLSMLNNEWGISAYPLVPGHEVIGTVSAAGHAVKHLQVGQRVGLGWNSGYCMTCSPCMGGDHNLCAAAEGTIVGRHGGFADKVRAMAASVVPLPANLDARSAGPLFCGGITVFNPLVQFDIQPTARVAVLGIGGLGHLALQFYNAWGCEVTALTSTPAKQAEARRLGAHDALDSTDSSALQAAARRFDLIVSTVNVALDWTAILGMLKPKGRLHFVGATLQPAAIVPLALIGGQYSVSGSPVGSPANIARMLDFSARHNIESITEHFAFADVNEALARLESGAARYRVVLSR
ncbi:MAG: NAD(P)-dependent alcohol dehydrogenase [Gammaproteobacteria bacterium]|jgi:uncharacterized zinc-type alcohol dehydrogenase-like protein|nr:NAD(P)-dependent alcohol dehydrogenase [Gammaproteobacteria bacterium]